MILVNLSYESLVVANVGLTANTSKLMNHRFHCVNERLRQLERVDTHRNFQEAIKLVFAKEIVVKGQVKVHLQEHGLNVEHVVWITVVECLVGGALQSPSIELAQEVFWEWQLCESTPRALRYFRNKV